MIKIVKLYTPPPQYKILHTVQETVFQEYFSQERSRDRTREPRNPMAETSIIFLNGASSSGKTTLGRALQAALEEPYFYLSSDQLVQADILPAKERRARTGNWSWRNIRPHFFDGFHRSIAASPPSPMPGILLSSSTYWSSNPGWTIASDYWHPLMSSS